MDYEKERLEMVKHQIAGRGIDDPAVLDVMRMVPRHLFVPAGVRHLAYTDGPLPIGEGQTISQPYIVALMTHLTELHPDDCALEIGTGSGYQAAILSRLCRQVYTIERHPSLARQARSVFVSLGYSNITVIIGDGSKGLPDYVPYDAIVVTAAAPKVSQEMLDQLAEQGRLIIPVGNYRMQTLECWRRDRGEFFWEEIIPVAFVPLLGESGWHPGEWRQFE